MYGMGTAEFILKVHFLMDPGSHRAPGFRGERRHGARGSGTIKTVVYNTLEEVERFGEVLRGITQITV
jgi:selenocysteine lyase/cysteine desulfurase